MHKLTAFASIDVAANNAAYYYHFDGLGSVVALSNSDGDSCQSYEYSAYGQVAASDPNFLTNPYMFTGRRFDIETGLYYYRARYYNPHIGRFMQTDPVGYSDGINWYLYCGNNPLAFMDPSGLSARITYILASDPNNTRHTKMHSGAEFIEFLEGIQDACDTMIFFEIISHGTTDEKGNPALGIDFGNGDVFGTGHTEKNINEAGNTWYGIEDYSDLLEGVFAPSAVIELEMCHSADGESSIGYAFKRHVPSASVWGYTGNSSFYLPFWLPWIWETHESWIDLDSEWVEIFL